MEWRSPFPRMERRGFGSDPRTSILEPNLKVRDKISIVLITHSSEESVTNFRLVGAQQLILFRLEK